ncbi:MAG: hypothetical protein V1773_07020 [bacterium]
MQRTNRMIILLILLIGIIIGCSENNNKANQNQQENNSSATNNVRYYPPAPERKVTTINKKDNPEEWIKHEFALRAEDYAIRFDKNEPQMSFQKISFKDGVFDIEWSFDTERTYFERHDKNNPLSDLFGHGAGQRPAAEAYLSEVEVVLKKIYELSKDVDIKTVKLKSTALLISENRWGEKTERGIVMLKVIYGQSNLKKIFTAWDANEDINFRICANSFYGRLDDPTR